MDLSDQILYEDNHLMVINKPQGILSQGDNTGDVTVKEILSSFIKSRDGKPGNVYLHTAHRLDRPVSGCLVLCKTSKSLPRMMKLFAEQKIHKQYIAITSVKDVQWDFDEKVIESYLVKDRKRNQVRITAHGAQGAKLAKTRLKWLLQNGLHHVFECQPQTGRSHQIRVHMRLIGAPILGDTKYGGVPTGDKTLYLHCRQLRFVHPVSNEIVVIRAPFPSGNAWKLVPPGI